MWTAGCGEIIVLGKGRRADRLPLTADVGEALVAYVSGARPRPDIRHVFLTCKAPRGPIRVDLVRTSWSGPACGLARPGVVRSIR